MDNSKLNVCGFVQNIAPLSLSRDRRIKMEQTTTITIGVARNFDWGGRRDGNIL